MSPINTRGRVSSLLIRSYLTGAMVRRYRWWNTESRWASSIRRTMRGVALQILPVRGSRMLCQSHNCCRFAKAVVAFTIRGALCSPRPPPIVIELRRYWKLLSATKNESRHPRLSPLKGRLRLWKCKSHRTRKSQSPSGPIRVELPVRRRSPRRHHWHTRSQNSVPWNRFKAITERWDNNRFYPRIGGWFGMPDLREQSLKFHKKFNSVGCSVRQSTKPAFSLSRLLWLGYVFRILLCTVF